MKKQFQLVTLILVICIFFCTSRDNNLKACGTNAIACSAIDKKNEVKHIEPANVNEEDGPLYMLTNPLIH